MAFPLPSFYEALAKEYLLSPEQLWANGYPKWMEEEDEGMEQDMWGEGRGEDEFGQKRRAKRVEIRQSDLDAGKSRAQPPFLPDAGPSLRPIPSKLLLFPLKS
jgi:hypothetical protein